MMTDLVGSLPRPKTAIEPTLIPEVGPKSVSGCQVGPAGAEVMKLVVFQTPPLAPPTYTVLPDGSDGSTASAPTMPDLIPPVLVLTRGAGPIDVQVLLDSGLAVASVKTRKL